MVKYSIIIPTFNRSVELKKCLKSLQNQTYKGFEVIISDDGSTDDTEDVVASFSDLLNIKYQKYDNWGGPARPRNLAMDRASGQWIAFLDSDDFWYPNKLSEVDKYTDAYDFIYHQLDFYDAVGNLVGRPAQKNLKNPVLENLLVKSNTISTPGVVVRKIIVDEIGGFSEDRSALIAEDYEYWLRIAKKTNKFKFIDVSLGGILRGGRDHISDYSEKSGEYLTFVYNKYLNDLSVKARKEAQFRLSYKLESYKRPLGKSVSKLTLLSIILKSYQVELKFRALVLLIRSLLKL